METTREQHLIRLAKTQIELRAYWDISSGFRTLAA